jgi:hypothetical protein
MIGHPGRPRPAGGGGGLAMAGPIECPNCGLWSPPGTVRCDCGYNFATATLPSDVRAGRLAAICPATARSAVRRLSDRRACGVGADFCLRRACGVTQSQSSSRSRASHGRCVHDPQLGSRGRIAWEVGLPPACHRCERPAPRDWEGQPSLHRHVPALGVPGVALVAGAVP